MVWRCLSHAVPYDSSITGRFPLRAYSHMYALVLCDTDTISWRQRKALKVINAACRPVCERGLKLTCSRSAAHDHTKEQMDRPLVACSSPAHHLSRLRVNECVCLGSCFAPRCVCLWSMKAGKWLRQEGHTADKGPTWPQSLPQVREQTGTDAVCIQWKRKLISPSNSVCSGKPLCNICSSGGALSCQVWLFCHHRAFNFRILCKISTSSTV